MSQLHILTEPNHELRLKSESVSDKELRSDEIQKLIADMKVTMKAADGIGLAAPQVGVKKRIIIVTTQKGVEAFVNPKIIRRSILRTAMEEGCLSIPGVYGLVKRFRSITIKARDEHGHKIKRKYSGLTSVIIQHEMDHLDGILFTDRADKFTGPPKL